MQIPLYLRSWAESIILLQELSTCAQASVEATGCAVYRHVCAALQQPTRQSLKGCFRAAHICKCLPQMGMDHLFWVGQFCVYVPRFTIFPAKIVEIRDMCVWKWTTPAFAMQGWQAPGPLQASGDQPSNHRRMLKNATAHAWHGYALLKCRQLPRIHAHGTEKHSLQVLVASHTDCFATCLEAMPSLQSLQLGLILSRVIH